MRIKQESKDSLTYGPNGTNGSDSRAKTRAQRASDHAAARIQARHAERDYFGRPIYERDPMESLSSAARMRAETGMVRLDAWLVSNGYAASREKAKALIARKLVTVNGTTNKVKPATPISDDMDVRVAVQGMDATETPTSPAEAGPASDGAEAQRDR